MSSAERMYLHNEVASTLALINMMKIKFMATPEIYRTLLSILCDYDPSKNRERTIRYIRLLIQDEPLFNCILMSMPETTPQRNTVVPTNMPHECRQTQQIKPQKLKCSGMTIKPKRTLNPHQTKTVFSPLKSKNGSKFQGRDGKLDTNGAVSKASGQSTARMSKVRDSPGIITCKQSSVLQLKPSKIGPKVVSSSQQVISQHNSHPSLINNPVIRPLTQGQISMDQRQLPVTTDTTPNVRYQTGVTFPFQYGDCQFPIQHSQMQGMQPYLALSNMLQLQQLNLMSQSDDMSKCVWPCFGNVENGNSGLDLSVQSSTENLPVKQPELQSQKTPEKKSKRSLSNTCIPTSESDGKLNAKKLRLSLDSTHKMSISDNIESVGTNTDPDKAVGLSLDLISMPKTPLEALQNLVSSIGSDGNKLNSKAETPGSTGKTLQNSDQLGTTGSCGDVNKKLVIPFRSFLYSQKIHLSDGKYSVVSFQQEKKLLPSDIQRTVVQNDATQTGSKVSKQLVNAVQRSYSTPSLLEADGADNTEVSALSSVVTEASKSQNSTTVKIKLNSSKSGKLLGELLRLQQSKASPQLQYSSSTVTQDGATADPPLPPAKKNLVTQFYLKSGKTLKSGTSLNLQGNRSAAKVTQGSHVSGPLHMFTGNLGQAFAIQAKPDFTTNKISVMDNALLQTIKERLKQNHQRSHSDSDLGEMKMSVDSQITTSFIDSAKSVRSKVGDHLSTDSPLAVSSNSELSSLSTTDTSWSYVQSSPYILQGSEVQDSSIEDDDVFTDETPTVIMLKPNNPDSAIQGCCAGTETQVSAEAVNVTDLSTGGVSLVNTSPDENSCKK